MGAARLKKAKRQPEAEVQRAVKAVLEGMGCFVWDVRNGATYDPVRKIYRANSSFKGVPDLCGMTRTGRFIGVEVKTATGRLTTHQRAFLEKIRSKGGISFVARSVDDVLAHSDEILNRDKHTGE
jgi:hypothetical protein